MDTASIWKCFTKTIGFVGVFPCDRIPSISKVPAGLVINTDPSQKPGEHWVAVHIDDDWNGTYFDSYGFPPLVKEITDFLDYNTKTWYFNTYQLQSMHPSSNSCGHFCVLFITILLKGGHLVDLIGYFNSINTYNNRLQNDDISKFIVGK